MVMIADGENSSHLSFQPLMLSFRPSLYCRLYRRAWRYQSPNADEPQVLVPILFRLVRRISCSRRPWCTIPTVMSVASNTHWTDSKLSGVCPSFGCPPHCSIQNFSVLVSIHPTVAIVLTTSSISCPFLSAAVLISGF